MAARGVMKQETEQLISVAALGKGCTPMPTDEDDVREQYARKLTMAYADPPYYGLASFYKDRHPEWAKWDRLDAHADLIDGMSRDYPDGWALSLHSPSLKHILPLCPDDVRVAAWVKPFASFKPGVNPAYAWEPIIFRGGRRRTDKSEQTVRDWYAANITLRRGFTGAKPEGLCWWLFELMGLRSTDTFVDLFPGSGAVSRAWQSYTTERLFAESRSA